MVIIKVIMIYPAAENGSLSILDMEPFGYDNTKITKIGQCEKRSLKSKGKRDKAAPYLLSMRTSTVQEATLWKRRPSAVNPKNSL